MPRALRALSALRCGTAPLPRFAPKGASRASTVRYCSPMPAQDSAFYAGKDKGCRKRDAEGRLSEPRGECRGSRSLEAKGRFLSSLFPFPYSQAPGGRERGIVASEASSWLSFPGCAAQPCRLARAKRRGRQVFLPFSRSVLQSTLTRPQTPPKKASKRSAKAIQPANSTMS